MASVKSFDHVWYWRSRLPERKGQRCRVVARGTMNRDRKAKVSLGSDHIYLLECVRDFGTVEDDRQPDRMNGRPFKRNLCELITLADHHESLNRFYAESIERTAAEMNAEAIHA